MSGAQQKSGAQQIITKLLIALGAWALLIILAAALIGGGQ